MEPFTIDTILPIASGALFITQAVYYLGLYNKLYTHSRETAYATDINTQNPPLSVIIVAKDAAHELQENLPFILEQDYPEFEVIVIYDRPADDCDNTLKLLEDKYPNLYHTFIPDSARYISHKKLGITMGIKASRHEWLVFTEPDCRPQSNQWLKQMARNFTPATEIVLGYSNYEKVPGWFNKKITFDTLLNSMRYLGMAVSGHPYMGTGRNMAYRKTLYYKQKGFASHLNLQRGEDDLFINETARAHNTRVEASPESLMRIAMPKYKRIWCEEKISYAATSRLFHGTAHFLHGFFHAFGNFLMRGLFTLLCRMSSHFLVLIIFILFGCGSHHHRHHSFRSIPVSFYLACFSQFLRSNSGSTADQFVCCLCRIGYQLFY